MDFVDIKDIQYGNKTSVIDNVLYINREEAEAFILEDSRLQSCSIDITHPDDGTRIICIQDIVEPRCKVEPEGTDFPGYVSKIQRVGYGVTRALRNTAIMVCSQDTDRTYFNYMETGGHNASISRYGKMPLVVLTTRSHDAEEYTAARMCQKSVYSTGAKQAWENEFVFKRAAYRLAVYLAKAGIDHPVSETKNYDLELNGQPNLYPGLPRVGYYCLIYTPQYDHHGISEPIFYGGDIGITLPTIVHPNEILDGCMTVPMPIRQCCTYDIQNNGIITELYARHGKELNFVGMALGVSHENALQRDRRAVVAATLMQDVLRAEGVVLSKVHGGMMHMDLASIAEELENRGVRTVPFHQGVSEEGTLSDQVLFKHPKIDAIVYSGNTLAKLWNNFMPRRILGGDAPTTRFYLGGSAADTPVYADAVGFMTDEYLLAGVQDLIGGGHYFKSANY